MGLPCPTYSGKDSALVAFQRYATLRNFPYDFLYHDTQLITNNKHAHAYDHQELTVLS